MRHHSADWVDDAAEPLDGFRDDPLARFAVQRGEGWRLDATALGLKSGGVPREIEVLVVVPLHVAERSGANHSARDSNGTRRADECRQPEAMGPRPRQRETQRGIDSEPPLPQRVDNEIERAFAPASGLDDEWRGHRTVGSDHSVDPAVQALFNPRLALEHREKPIRDPSRRDRSLGHPITPHDLLAVEVRFDFGPRQLVRPRSRMRQITTSIRMARDQVTDCANMRRCGLDIGDRIAMHEIDVIGRCNGRIDWASNQLFGQRLERKSPRDETLRGFQRRIGGIQVAEVNLAFVPATRADFVWSPLIVAVETSEEQLRAGNWQFRLSGVPLGDDYDPRVFVFASAWLLKADLAERIGAWRPARQTFVSSSQDWMFRAWRSGARMRFNPHPSVLAVPLGARDGSYRAARNVEHDFFSAEMRDNPRFRDRALEIAAVTGERECNRYRLSHAIPEALRSLIARSAAAAAMSLGMHPYTPYFALWHGRRGNLVDAIRRRGGLGKLPRS